MTGLELNSDLPNILELIISVQIRIWLELNIKLKFIYLYFEFVICYVRSRKKIEYS